jgi:hypothetical protein
LKLSPSQIQNAVDGGLADKTSSLEHWQVLTPYLGRGKDKSQDIAALGVAKAGFGCKRLPGALLRLAGIEDLAADPSAYVRPADLIEHGERRTEEVVAESKTDEWSRQVIISAEANSAKNNFGLSRTEDPDDNPPGAQVYAGLEQSVEAAHSVFGDCHLDLAPALNLPVDQMGVLLKILEVASRGRPPLLAGAAVLYEVDPQTLAAVVQYTAVVACKMGTEHVPLPNGQRYWRLIAITTLLLLPVLVPLVGSLPRVLSEILADQDIIRALDGFQFGMPRDTSLFQLESAALEALQNGERIQLDDCEAMRKRLGR